ncbi:MAG: flagellar basal body P-ring protein FlgI, partial [Planctomycetota bacterium]
TPRPVPTELTAPPIARAGAPQPAAAGQDAVVVVPPQGPTIEAPRQPDGRSNAVYEVTPRVAPVNRAGQNFEARVASPIRSLVSVRGMEENHVAGYGIVTGLDATGDSGQLATQLMANTLLAQNINIDPALLATANIAVVRVEGVIPAGHKPGQKFNVRVSSIGDAESLYGGSLTQCELTDITGQTVYATAFGALTVQGFSASGAGASTQKNHVTVGTLAGGGVVQRDIPTSVMSEHGFIYLDAKNGQGTFGNSVRIAEAINGLYPGMASVLPDGRTVRLMVMDGVGLDQVVRYLDHALNLEVETDNHARVVINERTGVIVMGGDVRLRPGVIHHGTIVVTVAETPEVSQPGPLSNGVTVAVPRTNLNVTENNNPMVLLGGATSLEEVVEVLNVLGATPRDMIAILEAMLQGGLLVAELRRV